MFAPTSHLWRESKSVANLRAETQICTRKNRTWLRFYSEKEALLCPSRYAPSPPLESTNVALCCHLFTDNSMHNCTLFAFSSIWGRQTSGVWCPWQSKDLPISCARASKSLFLSHLGGLLYKFPNRHCSSQNLNSYPTPAQWSREGGPKDADGREEKSSRSSPFFCLEWMLILSHRNISEQNLAN